MAITLTEETAKGLTEAIKLLLSPKKKICVSDEEKIEYYGNKVFAKYAKKNIKL